MISDASGFDARWLTGWGEMDQTQLGDVPAVAVTEENLVVVFSRGSTPVWILDESGRVIRTFGSGWFRRPHGVSVSGDLLLLTDDEGQRVVVASVDGVMVDQIEAPDQSAVTGYRPGFPDSVTRAAPPFCYPTHALRVQDRILVSDGYGNARVHVFDEERNVAGGWGEPGSAPGQFIIPHGLALDDDDRVMVCDRENERIQIFDQMGRIVDSWDDVFCPNNVARYGGRWVVAELGRRVQGSGPSAHLVEDALPARITVRDDDGRICAEWRRVVADVEDLFFAPHGIAVDQGGRVFVGEVRRAFGQGLAPPGPTLHCLEVMQWG